MSQRRSLEQKRAERAWADVGQVKAKVNQDVAKKYGKLARSAPADIQANGLGQTLAFWRAKSKGGNENEHHLLFSHVSDWVKEQLKINTANGDLLTWIVGQADTDGYRRATTEAIAFLTWLKRFAEAEWPD